MNSQCHPSVHTRAYVRHAGSLAASEGDVRVYVSTLFPRNLAAPIRRLVPINAALEISPHGKGSLDSKYMECRHTRAIRTIERRREHPPRVSGLVAALEISPFLKSRHGEISRKYGICQGISRASIFFCTVCLLVHVLSATL